MVTTRAGHTKKILGAELDDDDGGAALAGGTSPSRTSKGMPAPGAGGIDLGGGFRRRGSTKSPTAADGLVRALRLAGWAPSLPVPLPQQPDTSRSVTKVLSLLTRQENSDSAWVQGKSTGLVTQSPRNRQNNKETQFKRRNTMKC
jgi:hypothetical protein